MFPETFVTNLYYLFCFGKYFQTILFIFSVKLDFIYNLKFKIDIKSFYVLWINFTFQIVEIVIVKHFPHALYRTMLQVSKVC